MNCLIHLSICLNNQIFLSYYTFKFWIFQVINVGGHKYIAISSRVSLNGILRSYNTSTTQMIQKEYTYQNERFIEATNVLSVSSCFVWFLFFNPTSSLKTGLNAALNTEQQYVFKMLQLRSFSSSIFSNNLKTQTTALKVLI